MSSKMPARVLYEYFAYIMRKTSTDGPVTSQDSGTTAGDRMDTKLMATSKRKTKIALARRLHSTPGKGPRAKGTGEISQGGVPPYGVMKNPVYGITRKPVSPYACPGRIKNGVR